jgi:type I restriction enzyme, S subunit
MKTKPYSSYKDSGVEWIGEVPEHWEVKRLKNVIRASITDGPHETPVFIDEGIPFLSVDGIQEGELTFENCRYISIEAHRNYSKKAKIEVNDILLGKAASIGKVARVKVEFEFSIWSPLALIKPKLSEITPVYLEFLLKSTLTQYQIQQLSTLNTQQNISMRDIPKFIFLMPDIEEQATIANFLDRETSRIDSLIEEKANFIKLLKEKRQALITHAVTKGLDLNASEAPEHWGNFRLDWISTIIRGNTGFQKDELLNNGKYVALQYGKTYKVDEVNSTFNFYVNEEFYKANQVVHYGDTILISTSETIEDLGHSCFYNRKDFGLIGGEQILLKPKTELIFEKYLYYSSKVFCSGLKKYATGLKVFRFNIDDLKNIFITIPPVEDQQQIAIYLDDKTSKIDMIIEEVNHSIKLLKEHRSALISAAVTGKIDVRDQYTTQGN